jgi:hypothetical protein
VVADVSCGEVRFVVDGSIVVVARIEKAPPFRPKGISIESADFSTESFSISGLFSVEPGQTVSIRFPSHRLRSISRLNGLPVGKDFASDKCEFGQLDSFDLSSFGIWPYEADRLSLSSTSPIATARREWISAELRRLVYSMRGPRALAAMLKLKSRREGMRWAAEFSAYSVLPQLIYSLNRDELK